MLTHNHRHGADVPVADPTALNDGAHTGTPSQAPGCRTATAPHRMLSVGAPQSLSGPLARARRRYRRGRSRPRTGQRGIAASALKLPPFSARIVQLCPGVLMPPAAPLREL